MSDLRLPAPSAELDLPAPGARRAWVRLVDGRLVVTWQVAGPAGWRLGGTRPLTFVERLGWRAARRVPEV